MIEDNVFGPDSHTFSITWYSDNGSVIRHIRSEIGADGNGEGGGWALFSSSHNLLRRQRPIGPGDGRGAPRYVGPTTTFRGFRLARGSRGQDNASDGSDRGVRVGRRKAGGR